MSNKYVLVDLSKEQKAIISDKTLFFLQDSETKEDLDNNRKKWIRFNRMVLSEVIGELSYYFNRSDNEYESMVLDELIIHLEYYEKST